MQASLTAFPTLGIRARLHIGNNVNELIEVTNQVNDVILYLFSTRLDFIERANMYARLHIIIIFYQAASHAPWQRPNKVQTIDRFTCTI